MSSQTFNLTQYCLARPARQFPSKPALVFHQSIRDCRSWSFGGFYRAALQVANLLKQYGLARGQRIFIRLPHCDEYALAFFGAIAAGLVPVPVSPQLKEGEVDFLLQDSQASLILVSDELPLPPLRSINILSQQNFQQYTQFDALPDCEPTHAEDPAFLIYTSGTTNLPKGVLHAHRSVLGRIPMVKGWSGLQASDSLLHAGQLNWTYTLGVGLMDPWCQGATAHLYGGPKDPSVWAELIAGQHITLMAAVPAVYRQILKYSPPPYFWPSFRHGLTAGAPLPKDLLQQWRKATGTELYEALGMSEVSTYISSGPEVPVKPNSPGKPQPGRKVRVIPMEEGTQALPPHQKGRLAVHCSDPGLMLGYWNRPQEESDVFRRDWFMGGDIASMDEEGYVYFHGRSNELMNASGYRVSPLEIEKLLLSHPHVQDAAVAETEVQTALCIITAFVVLKAQHQCDEESLLGWLKPQLAEYKCPKAVRFVKNLPYTANGKLKRHELQLTWQGS